MTNHLSPSDQQNELQARLNLIESMISEGRQTTERWGWTFVLWGIAYYVAIAWASLGNANVAWPVTMLAASALTGFGASRQGRKEPETTIGRAIGTIWMCIGASLFMYCLTINIAHHAEIHAFVAVIEVMLGAANATSSIILKWKGQFLCALVWWTASIASCFGTENQSGIVFLTAIFFGQIVFGIYMMVSEARERKSNAAKTGEAHA